MNRLMVTVLMVVGACFLYSPAQAGNCPDFCAQVPQERWSEVPPCRGCIEEPHAPQCADWCKWVPSTVWGDIPACSGCESTYTSVPGCAEWCKYIPEPYRKLAYGCYECR
jgi:hypothetical protein